MKKYLVPPGLAKKIVTEPVGIVHEKYATSLDSNVQASAGLSNDFEININTPSSSTVKQDNTYSRTSTTNVWYIVPVIIIVFIIILLAAWR
jgi:hypothetical protein